MPHSSDILQLISRHLMPFVCPVTGYNLPCTGYNISPAPVSVFVPVFVCPDCPLHPLCRGQIREPTPRL